MKLIELTRDIFHVMFPTQLELTSTLLRFQEHFEGQEFKGKIFTLEEYKEWYVANSVMGKKTGMFTYYEDWSGFNFPSDTLGPFSDGKFDPLSDAESHFLNLFRGKR
ncbi:hypothetical protein KY326_04315, partial [Candidatus Woesearchaeota archaeon]|nr:hypothetical protein [Candidatus Woesearchaeota archaeon]